MTTVNDVTQLNPIDVLAVAAPRSTEELQRVVRDVRLPLSIGGGHFSMGGHTASPGSAHIDMRQMSRVLSFDPQHKTIRVEAGIRWCDIQRFVDPHGLAVKIMQTYANFTVGGALSVNCHGRYMGLGPVILSVRNIRLVLADGSLRDASPTENSEIFYAAIGGYGAVGIIAEAELDLVDNVRVRREHEVMPVGEYASWFDRNLRGRATAIFHNADVYPPHYDKVRAATWIETLERASSPRLHLPREWHPLEMYFLWSFTELPLGKWRRQFIVDPLLFMRKRIHWRNFEAGYDVAELEPLDRSRRTYVLQEYFVPVARFDEFMAKMAAVLQRHEVNVVNISIRHALGDPGSLLAWANGETFAFVLYYKQRTRVNAREKVAIWTRALVDAVLSCGGTYYLPYQLHPTDEQFHAAYPRARELFALKRKLDPEYRLRGALWDRYYAPTLAAPAARATAATASLFHAVYDDARTADRFYDFLENVFKLFPPDRLHTLIKEATARHADDESIYREIQTRLAEVTPPASLLTYALPSLARQKAEMGRQTKELLNGRARIDGYVEIGTTGRYVKAVTNQLPVTGEIRLWADKAAGYSPVDIVERGRLRPLGTFVPLRDYAPAEQALLPDACAELVSCYIGLHHIEIPRLEPFIASVARVLKPGGVFILRDHDVKTPQMHAFVSLAHAVFNAGLGEPWSVNATEPRYFEDIDTWIARLARVGLRHTGPKLLQAGDPTDNVLLAFERAA
jgi:FAD/FMN-containing dehydrogenase